LTKVDATTDADIARQISDDPDTAAELTDEFWQNADFHVGGGPTGRARGRPVAGSPKRLVSLRLDQDVIEHFRAGGPGWQSRINAALRRHLNI
jgi:uncharacterized protein (DUF4415 family)